MFIAYVDAGLERAVEALGGVTTAQATALAVLLSLIGVAASLADLTGFTIVEITIVATAGLVSQIVLRLAAAEMTMTPTDQHAAALSLPASEDCLRQVRYAMVTSVRLNGRALSPRRA